MHVLFLKLNVNNLRLTLRSLPQVHVFVNCYTALRETAPILQKGGSISFSDTARPLATTILVRYCAALRYTKLIAKKMLKHRRPILHNIPLLRSLLVATHLCAMQTLLLMQTHANTTSPDTTWPSAITFLGRC